MKQQTRNMLIASLEGDTEQPVRLGPVFLGGTCNGSKWREEVTPKIAFQSFNPVVENWSMETQQIEEKAKEDAVASLFVITPKQTGLYAVAELTAAAIREPERTVVAFLDKDEDAEFNDHQKASNQAIAKLVQDAGAVVVNSLDDAAAKVNEIVGKFQAQDNVE